MADNVPQAAPAAPSAAPAASSSGSSSSSGSFGGFSQPAGANSVDDIFANFEKSMGLSNDDQGAGMQDSRTYEEKSVSDLYADLDNVAKGAEGEQGETSDGTDASTVPQTEATEDTSEKPFEYDFKTTLGDEEKQIKFSSKEQLDAALRKALVADKIYDRYKKQGEEIKTYKESHDFAQRFDKMIAEKPTAVLDSIVEDMNEDEVSAWLIAKAEELSRDPKERALEKRLKEADAVREQMAEMTRQQELLQQQRVQAAQESDRHVVQSWGEGILAKAQARFPEEYHPIFEKELRSALMEGRQRRNAGENITIKTLDTIFARNIKPLIGLMQARKVSPKAMQAQVGKAIDNKKTDGLHRVMQSAGNTAQRQQQRPATDDNSFDTGKLFDHLIAGVGNGSIRMRG